MQSFLSIRVILQVCLWHFPDAETGPMMLCTEHAANIFGVRFLPGCGERWSVCPFWKSCTL